jgi:uncharacterized protein (DUF305 family)
MTGAGPGEAAVGEVVGVTDDPAEPPLAPAPRPRWVLGLLVVLLAATLVATGGAVAVLTGVGQPYRPTDGSLDTGFTRDMITHHDQAVQMAQVARDHSTDPAVRLLAFDIETQQLGQIGQMRGWLQTWQLPEQTDRPHMAWMGSQAPHQHSTEDGALMPGMATTAEMTKLRSLSGTALDVFFLQLMIRHHQGALPMGQYAAANARVGYVAELAGKVVSAQTSEIVTMEQMLRERGGTPLPAP